uniref:F-box protein At3g16210 n=1 Tax=Nicotiana sylvestris TaxID=4096 RepID=A0A1U7W2L5_NICSY|nr:PREDICTED: putative F-box protein At3g16210 [Nicotiana sylvestris]
MTSPMGRRSSLPDDIIIFLLLNLPIKSLLRFKSICKSWYSSINDPEFIKLHLHNSSANISRQKILLTDNFSSFKYDHSSTHMPRILSIEASLSVDSKVMLFDPPLPRFRHECSYLQVCSCNGLVLMFDYHDMILWNPAIRKYKSIPIPNMLQRNRQCVRLGFDYDYVADDYKVLFVQVAGESYCYGQKIYNVQIFSVNNQS